MIAYIVAIAFAVLAAHGQRRDPRMLRNGVFLAAAIVAAVIGTLSFLSGLVPEVWTYVRYILFSVLYLQVVGGVLLVVNGVTMLRKEGRSLGNQLSLVLGVGVAVLPFAAIALVVTMDATGLLIATALMGADLYLAFIGLAFALYSVVIGRRRLRTDAVAVIVHGSGLIDGRVPPLLAGRLERGIDAYRTLAVAGADPVIVPSGGQGHDESRPEAEAMAEYLVDRGVPSDDVLPEPTSTTTQENLRNAVAVLREAGHGGPVVLVTSDYHVLRTASLARRLDVDAQVIGSTTAWYYVPSAFLRELAAILSTHRRMAAAVLVPFLAVAVAGIHSLLLSVPG